MTAPDSVFDYTSLLAVLPTFDETETDRVYVGDFVAYMVKGSDTLCVGQLSLAKDPRYDNNVYVDGHVVGYRSYSFNENHQKDYYNTFTADAVERNFTVYQPLRYFPTPSHDDYIFSMVAKRLSNFIGSYVQGYPVNSGGVRFKLYSYELDEVNGIVRLGYKKLVDDVPVDDMFEFDMGELVTVSGLWQS